MALALIEGGSILIYRLVCLSTVKEDTAQIVMGFGKIVLALLYRLTELTHSTVYISKLIESKAEVAVRFGIATVSRSESLLERIDRLLQLSLAVVDQAK